MPASTVTKKALAEEREEFLSSSPSQLQEVRAYLVGLEIEFKVLAETASIVSNDLKEKRVWLLRKLNVLLCLLGVVPLVFGALYSHIGRHAEHEFVWVPISYLVFCWICARWHSFRDVLR